MRGEIGSLNAAVAGSVLLFEAVGQREAGVAAGGPPTAVAPVGRDAHEAGAPDAPDTLATAPKPPPPRQRRRRGHRRRPRRRRTARTRSVPKRATPKAPTPDLPPDDDLLPGGPPTDATTPPKKQRPARTPRA